MTKPQLCVTVTAPTMAELRRRRDAVGDADLVELRLDGVADPDASGAIEGRRHPVIVTCRPTWEGGAFAGAEEPRLALLRDALKAGAEFVDVEWRADTAALIEEGRGRVIVSAHDFDGVPGDLGERARAMRQTGAAVVKIAVRAHRLGDCLPLLELASAGGNGSTVLIAMGTPGLITRVLPGRFGSRWAYAGSIEAVGQVSPEALVNRYRFHALSAETAVYGLVGSPIDHSVSPDMHNAAFAATGRDAVYLPLPASDAGDFAAFARAFGLRGASVTIPFKVALLEHLDEVTAVARQAGAVNTIRMDGGRWVGTNTDVAGFLAPLRDRGIALRGTRAAVLGAGGSARAAALALASAGADVTLHARRRGRADDTARVLGVAAAGSPPPAGSWDLLVNCTPVGMHPHAGDTPLEAAALSGRCVYDLVYNPVRTRLLREAAAAGCATIGGLDMLVGQAHEQFQWWTGIQPPAGVMRAAAERRLAEFIADEDHVV